MSVTDSVCYIILSAWAVGFTFYTIFCLALLVYKDVIFSRIRSKKLKNISKGILLVIAHPDDEVMFFGPTILDMTQDPETRKYFHVLCLSNGDHDGVGKVRIQELWKSCKTLGIKSSNITLLNYDTLKDGPNNMWSPDLIAQIVLNHAQQYSVHTILTFDKLGVSGHRNHMSIYLGMEVMLKSASECNHPLQVFVLESVNLIRKYCMHVLDVPLSYAFSNYMYSLDFWQRANVVKGMNCHKSQLNWYRHLYLFFSRYTILNTLHELTLPVPAPEMREKNN